ncbi:glutamate--tRNA ligase [Spiroplasma endosymbiont of Amphibalanus improvisus]|uniref:glutamate--tRNA ligase n=1 Tax=Spiroplasma endosymbiont of Amphibalanus improvisus TaxID=3066327 RepID=UPI00313D185E
MEKQMRIRYAPSPTGQLHIGNARTALFDYLLAKHYKGVFVLRVEDTDVARNIKNADLDQINDLKWLGVEIDEGAFVGGPYGPYFQLERLEIYKKYVDILIKEKKAYHCFCTEEKLENDKQKQSKKGNMAFKYNRTCYKLTPAEIEKKLKLKTPYNVRFLVPENTTYKFKDLIRGDIEFKSLDIGDWIIQKTNKIPTYNFAVVIDDELMKITHVLRGEEHISNTPKQIMIFEAFNWKIPTFGHLTIIVKENRKKLSKRDNDYLQFISQYRELGYLPEAILNFLALLGWSPGNEKEIFSKDQLIKMIDEKKFSKSPSVFDIKKLQWINSKYIKEMNDIDYINFAKPFLEKYFNLDKKNKDWINCFLITYKKEILYADQLKTFAKPFFENTPSEKIDLSDINFHKELKEQLLMKISDCKNFSPDDLKSLIKEIGLELNIKGKELYMPIRIMCSGAQHGPELNNVIYLLGKNKVIENIRNFNYE